MRRARRLVGWALLWLATAAAALLVAALLAARSEWGRRRLLALALPSLQARFDGELSIGGLQGDLTRRVILRDVEVRDREGHVAVHVRHLALRYDLAALWRHTIRLDDVEATGLWVHAQPLADGRMNLAALLRSGGPPSSERHDAIEIAHARIEGELRLDDARRPLQGRLRIEGSGLQRNDRTRANIDALTVDSSAPLVAHASGRGAIEATARGMAVEHVAVTVDADGAQLQRLAPAAELRGSWRASISAHGPLDRLACELDVRPPRGQLLARGTVGVDLGGVGWQARVSADGIDPGDAWSGAPHGRVAFEAEGKGQNGRGEVSLQRLLVDVAGAHAEAHGRAQLAARPTVEGELDLDARDLWRLAVFGLPGLSGELRAHVHVDHRAGHTRLAADLHARALALAAARVRRLDAHVDSLDLAGDARLSARDLVAGATHINALTLAAHGDRRALALRLDARGADLQARLALHGAPILRAGRPIAADATVDELDLVARGQRWQATRPARLHVDAWRRLAMRVDGLALRSGAQAVTLDGRWEAGQIDVTAGGTALDAPTLLALAGVHRRLPHTRLDARVRLTGRVDAPIADGELSGWSERDEPLGYDRAQWRVRAHYQDARARGELRAQTAADSVGAHFDLPTRLRSAATPLFLQLDGHSARLSGWRRHLPAAAQTLDGEATLNLRLSGTTRRPELEARLAGTQLRFGGLQNSQATVAVLYREAQLSVDARAQLSTADGPAGTIAARGQLPIELGRNLVRPMALARLVHTTPIAATITVEQLDVARASSLTLMPARQPLRAGVLDARLEVSGTVHEPDLRLDLSGRGLATAQLAAVDARVRLRYAHAQAQLDLSADLRGAPLLTLTGRTTLPFQQIADGERWQDAPLAVEATLVPYDLARFAALGGRLSGALRLSGTVGAPRGQAQLAVEQLRVSETRFRRFEARGAYDGAQTTAWLRAEQPTGGSLRLDAAVPRRSDVPWTIALAGHGLALDVRPGTTDWIRTLKGVLAAELTVGGTRARPTVVGGLRIDGGSFALPGDPRQYDDLKLDLTARDGKLALNKLAMKVGGGSISFTGNGVLEGLRPLRLDLTAQGDRVPILAGGLGAYLDTAVQVHAERAGDRAFAGRLTVQRGTLHLPKIQTDKKLQSLEPMKDVVFTDERARAQAAARRNPVDNRAPVRAQLVAQIPGPFYVRSKEVNADLKGTLRVEVVGPVTKVTGHVEALGGWVDLLGRRYTLDRVRLGFDGSPELDPELDIRATREVTDAVIVVEVQGTARKPQLLFSSEPPIYDQSQIAGIVVSGDPGASRVSDRTLDQKVVGALSSVIVGRIKDQIAPGLPIDVLKVDTGSTGYTGFDQTRIEVGKYLTESIYVSYVHQFGQVPTGTRKINANQAQVEYRFKRGYELDSMFGDAGVGSIDFFWTVRF